MTFGTQLPPSIFQPLRSVIAEPEQSISGNTVLRVGREITTAGSYERSEHVVLKPEEARDFALLVIKTLPDDLRESVIENLIGSVV